MSDDEREKSNANDTAKLKFVPPPEHVEKVSLKVPAFWEKAPELYFANIEAQFSLSNVTQDTTKYYAVIASLNSEVLSHISDIVLNPPATGKYDAVKKRLVNEFADSQEKRLKALLSEMVLGDDRPSHLLRKMTQIAGTNISTEIVKSLWLKRLPQQSQAILSIANDKIENLALMADKLVEISKPQATDCYAVTANDTKNEMADLKKQIAELTRQVSQITNGSQHGERFRSRDRNSYPRRYSKSPARNRKRNTADDGDYTAPSNFCYYHEKFGAKARNCRSPCSYPENE